MVQKCSVQRIPRCRNTRCRIDESENSMVQKHLVKKCSILRIRWCGNTRYRNARFREFHGAETHDEEMLVSKNSTVRKQMVQNRWVRECHSVEMLGSENSMVRKRWCRKALSKNSMVRKHPVKKHSVQRILWCGNTWCRNARFREFHGAETPDEEMLGSENSTVRTRTVEKHA